MPPSGYAWWYFDGISEDQRFGITVIAFLGSVFSPYYFSTRKKNSETNPLDFSAFNVALYGDGIGRWTFTEQTSSAVRRNAVALSIGRSRIVAENEGEIEIDINESSPFFRRPVKGRVRIAFLHRHRTVFFLDPNGKHKWQPIVPRGEMEVHLAEPSLRFIGSAYHDMNWGEVPLETDFLEWSWSRHALSSQTAVFYDGLHTTKENFSIAQAFDDEGNMHEITAKPAIVRLPDTRIWRCPRPVRSEAIPRVIRTLEDSPFYARSLVETSIGGETGPAVQETLRLNRFVERATQFMLPFRLRRET